MDKGNKMFNMVDDTKALQMVRHFHRKRIARFGKGKEFKEIEGKTDLRRSHQILQDINSKIGKN